MNTASRHPCKCSPPQVKPVRIIGISDMEQALDRFLAKQIHRRRGYLVLGRIFPGYRPETFHQGYRHDFNKFQHVFKLAPGILSNIVPDISGTRSQGPKIFIPFRQKFVRKPVSPGQVLSGVIFRFVQIHGKHHWIFISL